MMPVRVLHIFGTMDRGGAETRTIEIMRNLHDKWIRFEFVSLSGQAGDFDEEIRRLDGEVHYLKLGLTFPFRFLKLLLTRRFDCVHSHVHFFSGWLLLLAAIAGVRQRIAHFRSTGDGVALSRLRDLRNRLLRSIIKVTSTNVVGVSVASLDAAFQKNWRDDKRFQVIYSGVDLSKCDTTIDPRAVRDEFGIPHEAPVLVHVGRQAPEKNHLRLVKIFLKLPGAHLLLVGRREEAIERQLIEIGGKAGAGARIHFAGLREDVLSLVAASDLMIFPSLREGLPGAVVEARAVGTPVLASAIEGIVELKEHFPELALMSLNEEDERWAEAAEQLLDGGKPAFPFPARFDASLACSDFEHLYFDHKECRQ